MKNILSILGTITLIGTSTTSLVACNKPQYSEDELKKEKEKNNIKTNDGILEWIAPQEKPFNQIDNKYYFVVWRGDKNDDWRIVKFQNNIEVNKGKIIDNTSDFTLNLTWAVNSFDLTISAPKAFKSWYWRLDNKEKIKAVYRWNNDTSEPNLVVDINGNLKVNK